VNALRETIWVLGDQLSPLLGPLATADPSRARILFVESTAKIASRHWHLQRAHLVVSGMRHLADDLDQRGFHVDYRRADSLRGGLEAHRTEFGPTLVTAMEPASWDGLEMLKSAGVSTVRSTQFLTHPDEFASWAGERRSLKMEDFYRWQRRRLGYLMDGDEPAGGRWNFDHDNRQPPPKGAHDWPAPHHEPLDDIDRQVLADLSGDLALAGRLWGADPDGTWPTSRRAALAQLDHVVELVLPGFGPHEDAMLSTNWHLAHTLLSPALNLGMLHPREVCDAVERAYRAGTVPIASAEGVIRQIIGWREYVWGTYWLWMPGYRTANELDAHRPLPPLFTGSGTQMRCLSNTLEDVRAHGWTHHIQRLMLLGNLALLAGVEPQSLVGWMWESFVDGAEWVMLPNVLGMALHADGGRMATKPYAAGGAYIDKMSDYCKGCRYDRKQRTGPDACPFTTLYWAFLDRHRDRFLRNARMAQQVRAMERLNDLEAVRDRAGDVLRALDEGIL